MVILSNDTSQHANTWCHSRELRPNETKILHYWSQSKKHGNIDYIFISFEGVQIDWSFVQSIGPPVDIDHLITPNSMQ